SKLVPESSSQQKVRVGKLASITVLVIAVFWAPQIGKQFGTLLKYYQEMLSIVAPPIVAAFILGIFWKRTNGSGAFWGLIAGILLGIANVVFKIYTGTSIFGDIHFLLTVPFYFAWSLFVMIIISLATDIPPLEKTADLTFTLKEFRNETLSLREKPFYESYRFLSYLLIAFYFLILFLFW
ncbi:MAG TPA: hypothetical protein PKD85_03080, partial [Saprospiraceae bacterium]|nr:hypothetical protein [Saprospiraceae bacterium]